MRPKPERTHPNAAAFPAGLSGPALRALAQAGIRSMTELADWTMTDLAALHGMGRRRSRCSRTREDMVVARSGDTCRVAAEIFPHVFDQQGHDARGMSHYHV